MIYYAQGLRADGDAAFAKARTLHRKTAKTGNSLSAEAINERGNELFKQDRYWEAAMLYDRARNLYEIAKGSDHPYVAQAIENHVAALRKLNRHAIADALEIHATRIRDKAATPATP